MKYPAGLLGGVEGVDVEDGLPVRRGGVVVGHGGATEDAAGILGVAPEVVDEVAAQVGKGKAVGVLEDLEGFRGVGGDAGIGFEQLGGAGVLSSDPIESARAVHVFEPDVLVVGRGGGLCEKCGG